MVVGSSEAASTAEDRRGARPVARAAAAAICTPALMRTMVTGSVGTGTAGATRWASGTTLSVTREALGASVEAFLRAEAAPTKNTDASIGRATSLMTVMGSVLP